MTKVISRFFDTAAQAQSARKELIYRQNLSQRIVALYDQPDRLTDMLSAAHVAPATAQAYQARMAKTGGVVMVVRAGYKPLGVAQITRDVTAAKGAAALDDLVQEVFVDDTLRQTRSVLSDHPLFLTQPKDPFSTNYHMANWPIPLISRRAPFKETVFPRHARMANWPIGLISKRTPSDRFAFPRHARMANFPLPLLSKRKPSTRSVFARHARMADFPISLISRRKPYSGTAIGRHTRMAGWPFPHLINGKSQNALIPGGPRMANFPIPLLSRRAPSDRFAFPRHARMADVVLPLISRRAPADRFAFPRHARMADFILPLVSRRGHDPAARRRWSLSALLGLPTVMRR